MVIKIIMLMVIIFVPIVIIPRYVCCCLAAEPQSLLFGWNRCLTSAVPSGKRTFRFLKTPRDSNKGNTSRKRVRV